MAHAARRFCPKRRGAHEEPTAARFRARAGSSPPPDPHRACALPRSSYSDQCRHQKRELQLPSGRLQSKVLWAPIAKKFRNLEP